MIGSRLSRVRMGSTSNGFSNRPAGTARHEVMLDGTERHLAARKTGADEDDVALHSFRWFRSLRLAEGGGGVEHPV